MTPVAEQSGITVRLVEGEEANVKITTAFDLAVAEYRLQKVLANCSCGLYR